MIYFEFKHDQQVSLPICILDGSNESMIRSIDAFDWTGSDRLISIMSV